jgi:hypothetical protein
MESSQLDALRQLAASFRSAIEHARAGRVPGALPYFPEGACRLTSRLFALHLTRRTDSTMFGRARLVSGVLPGSEFGARHYWLELDGAVVDLTADAFGQPAVVVGPPTAFHHTLAPHAGEPAAENLASLSADDMARLTRQLAAIEPRMPAFATPVTR